MDRQELPIESIVWGKLYFFWIATQTFFTAALAEHDPTITVVVVIHHASGDLAAIRAAAKSCSSA